MAEKRVKIEALTVLRAEDGKPIPVGGSTEVLESTATILVNKKKAKLVKAEGARDGN